MSGMVQFIITAFSTWQTKEESFVGYIFSVQMELPYRREGNRATVTK